MGIGLTLRGVLILSGCVSVDSSYNGDMDNLNPDDAIQAVEHTADWSLRVRGRDLTALFRYAAIGIARLLAGDVSVVPLDTTREIVLEAYDGEGLLVDWLSELAYWAECEGLVGSVINCV